MKAFVSRYRRFLALLGVFLLALLVARSMEPGKQAAEDGEGRLWRKQVQSQPVGPLVDESAGDAQGDSR
jgi:hypothetical protein